ncbi:MAG: AAA family ATPase [Gammaproteobacteria bacterium]
MTNDTTNRYFNSIDDVAAQFMQHRYITDRLLATTVYLATALNKPVYLEGEPGVGKTEVAKTLAAILDTKLIRLQCYEGLDTATALYEWNYPKQMLELRLQEARGTAKEQIGHNLFAAEFLLARPLLEAIRYRGAKPPVLLIDEIDRSDEEFEAFLLEVLADFQITIPELGTLKAEQPPLVILTSNRTRELHDALKRRCLFHWLDYPDLEREKQILQLRLPGIEATLSHKVCAFMQWLRQQDLYKAPGIAETLDWASALLALGLKELDAQSLQATLGCVLKHKSDLENIQAQDSDQVLQQINVSLQQAAAGA